MFEQLVTFLYAADLERSAGFYEEALGLPLALDQGTCRIYRVSDTGFIGICQCRAERPVNVAGVIVTLVVDDVDGWYGRLRKAGAATDGPPRKNTEFQIYHFFFTDPDGYKIEVQRFEDPDWPRIEN